MDNLGEEYLSTVIRRLKYYKELGERTFEQMEEKIFIGSRLLNRIVSLLSFNISQEHASRWTNFLTRMAKRAGVTGMMNLKYIIIPGNNWSISGTKAGVVFRGT
jgi:hypothetical protein